MLIEKVSGVRVRLRPSIEENWLWNGSVESFCKTALVKINRVSLWSEVTTEEKDELITEYEAENPMPSNSVRSINS